MQPSSNPHQKSLNRACSFRGFYPAVTEAPQRSAGPPNLQRIPLLEPVQPRQFFDSLKRRLTLSEYNTVVCELKSMSDSQQTKRATLGRVGAVLGEENMDLLQALERILAEVACEIDVRSTKSATLTAPNTSNR